MNNVRAKVQPRCKLSYKVFEEQDGYDPLLEISMFPTLIQLKAFLGGLQHCFKVVGNWFFDSDINFLPPLTRDDLDYCVVDQKVKVVSNYPAKSNMTNRKQTYEDVVRMKKSDKNRRRI